MDKKYNINIPIDFGICKDPINISNLQLKSAEHVKMKKKRRKKK